MSDAVSAVPASIPDANLDAQLAALMAEKNRREQAKRTAEHESLLGRCFKYSNSYGHRDRWWMYLKIVEIGEYWPLAFKFQTCLNDGEKEYRLEPRDLTTGVCSDAIGGGYIEITQAEFDVALNEFLEALTASAAEARRAETGTGSVEDESAVPEGNAP